MNEGQSIYKLPKGWNWVKLEQIVDEPKKDLVDGPFGSNLKADEFVESGIPVFKIQNIKANRFIDKRLSFITKEKAEKLNRHSFKDGDLIITKLGDPLGLCCKVPQKYSYGIIVADLMRLRPSKDKINDQYLVTVINSEVVQKQFKAITKGTTRPRVNLTIVRNLLIPLPPKITQLAIVSKVEELFSDLDKGVEQLKTAQQQLKTYRQAVLKWAFEGKLTNEDIRDGELPVGWKMQMLKNLGTWKGGGTPSKANKSFWEGGHILWVSPKDMKSKVILNTIDKITTEAVTKSSAKLIDKGSILFVVRSGILRRTLPVAITTCDVTVNQDLQAFTPKDIIADYIYWYVQAKNEDIRRECSKDGTTVESIESSLLKNYPVPVCSIEEQAKIVQEIESRLSVADKTEETINESLQQAEALRQSILKKAFEGKLVATDTIETTKETAKVIPLERKVLAGKLIHLLHGDKYFGLTKFQKTLYLVENYAEVPYETNFLQDRAGPHDKEFTTAFRKEMQEKDWLHEEQKGKITKFILGDNIGSLIKDYAVYFREKGEKIVFVIQQLKDKSTHEAELIATLYAVWNNRLLKKKPVKIDLLVEDFFNWSPKKKEEFQPEEVEATYKWMKKIKLLPSGFGKFIGID